MSVRLVVLVGKHKGRAIDLPPTQFTIGRDSRCHLRPASSDVSRYHCAVACRGRFVQLCDFKSANGTFLNGERVTRIVRAHDGDILDVGPLKFQIKVDDDLARSRSTDSASWLMRTPDENEVKSLDPTLETKEEIPVLQDENSQSSAPGKGTDQPTVVAGDYLREYFRRDGRSRRS